MYVRVQARHERDGIYMAPSFYKEIDKEDFHLPNFFYWGCEDSDMECLRAKSKTEYDLIEFAKKSGVTEEKEAMAFAIEYSVKVMKEYRKTRMVEILSDPKIGKCIIFYPDKQHFIAYIPDKAKIHNKF